MDKENLHKDWKDNKETCPFCGAPKHMQDWKGNNPAEIVNHKDEFWIQKFIECNSCKRIYGVNYVGMLKIECIEFDWTGEDVLVIDPDGNVMEYQELLNKKKKS